MSGVEKLDIAFRVGPFPKLSETFVLDQIKGMIDRGHNVSVLADEVGDVAAKDGALAWLEQLKSVEFIQSKNPLMRLLPYRIRNARRQTLERRMCAQNDVVICNFGWFGQSVAGSADGTCKAKIMTIFHGADMSSSILDAGDAPYAALLRDGDLHLPISAYWRKRLLALGGPMQRIAIHRMGVDLSAFSFQVRQHDPNEPFQFIIVARLVEKKGVEYALRAFAALKASSETPPFVADIVGGGPLEADLKTLSASLKLGDTVRFIGELPHAEVASYLQAANAFVLPSVVASNGDMEGIPVSLMEAMASGLPVISTRHSGIPELIQHGENGLLADERDIEGLAAIMMQTMMEAEASRTRAVTASETVAARFNSQRLNDQLERFAKGLAAGDPDVRSLADEPLTD